MEKAIYTGTWNITHVAEFGRFGMPVSLRKIIEANNPENKVQINTIPFLSAADRDSYAPLIACYGASEWAAKWEEIWKKPLYDRERTDFFSNLPMQDSGNMDSVGRFRLGKKLYNLIGSPKELLIAGNGDNFIITAKTGYTLDDIMKR